MKILESLHTQIIMLATLKKETENSFCHLIKILLSCIRTFPYVKLGLTIGLTIVIKQLQNGVVIVHSVVRRTSFIKAWFVSTVTFQTNRLVHGGNLIWVRHFCKSFIWSHSQHVWYFRNVDSHKKKTPTSKQLAACANYVLALLNISIILLMLCRTMWLSSYCTTAFSGRNCDEHGGKNNNDTHQESSIHKQIFLSAHPHLWSIITVGIYLNDNTLCCAITQQSFLSFFFIKHSSLAQGQHW